MLLRPLLTQMLDATKQLAAALRDDMLLLLLLLLGTREMVGRARQHREDRRPKVAQLADIICSCGEKLNPREAEIDANAEMMPIERVRGRWTIRPILKTAGVR